jgi:AcrR family transcriptional regulator
MLSPAAVVDHALRIVDEEGADALTLSAVAGRAGVAPPSLYKHVRSLAELRALVSGRVMEEMESLVSEAVLGRSGDDALRALMHAWRSYVTQHPHRYSAMNQSPDPATAATGERLVGIMLAALRAYELEGARAIHATRCVRAAVHGFGVLEAAGAFQRQEELDESYDLLIHMVISALRSLADPSAP